MVKFRRYCFLSDFSKVYNLCVKCYTIAGDNGICAPYWEYGQSSGDADVLNFHRIGLWEDDGELVGVATYETQLGEAFFILDPQYSALAEEMLIYAETQLCDKENKLCLNLSSGQTQFIALAKQGGYSLLGKYPEKVFSYGKCINYSLPCGYRFLDNVTELIDIAKLDVCLHYGFDHEGEPDGDLDFRIHMSVTPNFRSDLCCIVVDNDGNYVCYAGIWVVPDNKLAYLEPLCVHPLHRKKGIAAAAIAELIRRTTPLGCNHITGGSGDFYTAIGYQTVGYSEVWGKKVI
ncbi:MAG: GNAT family N-acetyltransferase [Clostridia bacterium]|nr:GNAT family N-acetyltransferase [Clostridia bacterium]